MSGNSFVDARVLVGHDPQPCKRNNDILEPEMKRHSHIQVNAPRAQALVRGYFPRTDRALEDRLVCGRMTMA
jgi:hypothetical protein